MTSTSKLLSIGFCAPLIAFAFLGAVWSSGFLALAVVGYPIMVAVTLALLFPIHVFFAGRQVKRLAQLPIVFTAAIACSFSLYIALFFDAVFSRGAFSTRLAVEYCSMGLVAAICAWALYNFGPFSLTVERTNNTVERDGPEVPASHGER